MEKYLGYSRYLRECLNIKKDDLNHSGNQTNHLRHESSHPGFFFKNLISYFGIWSAGYWSTLDNLADELMETFRNSLTLSISFVHLQNIWQKRKLQAVIEYNIFPGNIFFRIWDSYLVCSQSCVYITLRLIVVVTW